MSDNLYLPDYSSLWSSTPTPAYLIDTSRSSHSNGGGNTSTTNNVQNTTNTNSNSNPSQNHATSQSHLAILQKNAQSRAVYHHSKGDHLPSRGGRTKWKKGLKFCEKQRGYTFTGCSLTEQEEKELSDEEDARAGWRDHILSYGQSNIVILGKGKTAREEEQDLVDRGAPGAYNSTHHRPGTANAAANANANRAANQQQPQSQQEQNAAANADNADDDDVFQGEYTLDHGSSDDDQGDAGLDGGGDVDLDAGLQSMD